MDFTRLRADTNHGAQARCGDPDKVGLCLSVGETELVVHLIVVEVGESALVPVGVGGGHMSTLLRVIESE